MPETMTNKHRTENSWYMKKTSLSPSLGEAEQVQAFAELAAAQHALRSHLHGCGEVAGHILAKATDAASGRKGSKNEAKKFFHSEGPTEARLEDCTHPANQEALSLALHALGGKQALYSECATLAWSTLAKTKTQAPQPEGDFKQTYLGRLKALESAYIKKRNHLVNNNLRLVAAVINKLHFQSLPWEDLLQHGAISLQKAVESFDASKGAKFSTYAVPVIKGDLIRAMENFGQEVRIPNHLWVHIRKYNRTEQELCSILGRTPTHVEMASELGISVQEAAKLQQYQWAPVSLDAPHGHSEEGTSLVDTRADPSAPFPGGGLSLHEESGASWSEGLDSLETEEFGKHAGDPRSPRRVAA